MRFRFLPLLLFALPAFAQPMRLPDKVKAALLVVDVQNAYVPGMAEEDQRSAPEAINAAIHLFRQFKRPVIRIYDAQAVPGSKNFEMPESIQVKADDPKVVKTLSSAFRKTDLDRLLKDLDVNTVFICGLSATGCALATYRDAEDRELMTFMVKDGLMSPKADQTKFVQELCDSAGFKTIALLLASGK